MVYAHRLAFMLGVGVLPPGMKVLHRCDNPTCITAHLFAGTQSDNMRLLPKRGFREARSAPEVIPEWGRNRPGEKTKTKHMGKERTK